MTQRATSVRTSAPLRAIGRRLAFALLLVLGAVLSPQAARAGASHRSVKVVGIEGEPITGALAGLTATGATLDGREAPIALDAVREIRFEPDALTAPRSDATRLKTILRGDEILVGTVASGNEVGVEFEPAGLPPTRVPFDVVRRIERASDDPCADPGRIDRPRPGSDIAYSRSGDAFAGTLVSADAQGATLEQSSSKRTIRWSDLKVLHVDEPPLTASAGLVMEIETAGGSRLVATEWQSDGASLRVKSRSGISFDVPLGAITTLRLTGGKFVYACDLAFTSQYTPTHPDDKLERWFGALPDRLPQGCPLRVRGVTYRHGISAHAKSTVRVPLGKQYRRFEAKFAIDDLALAAEDGLQGSATARVLADSKEVWSTNGDVKGGEAPKTVGPIDVSGVETLVLETDWGEGQDVNDWTEWLDPILVR